MTKYVEDCRRRYPSDQFPLEFVQCVFDEAKKNAGEKELTPKNTKAFVELRKREARRAPVYIDIDKIRRRAGTEDSLDIGFYVWRQADVVEQKGTRHDGAYCIKPEFWIAFLSLRFDDRRPGI
tara:strand:+ start:345 stop:713 length:369 start_codon:yes stop_codon:yes gene_type:complete